MHASCATASNTNRTCRHQSPTPGHRSGCDLVAHIRDNSTGRTILEAQSHLADWYIALGFTIVGDEYIEDGIPHVPMSADSD